MQDGLLIQFDRHLPERERIGVIILAYGELELVVMDLLRATFNGDTMTAVRTLYRLRSESNRLQVADALVRPKLTEQGLGSYWEETLAALNHCKKIRNHYTHSQWISDKGILRFGDLDEAAKGNGTESQIRFRPITADTLTRQYDYFKFTDHLVLWLADQYRLKTGQDRQIEAHIPKPKRIQPVSLDSREEAHSLLSSSKARKLRGK